MNDSIRHFIAGLSILAIAPGLYAQAYGQWMWRAGVGAESNQVDSSRDDESTTRDMTRVRLSGGLTGFIINPIIGRFDLDTSVALDTSDSAQSDGEDLLLSGRLALLPLSVHPSDVWVNYGNQTTTQAGADDALASFGSEVTSLGWGVNTRVEGSKSPLRGTKLQIQSLSLKTDDSRDDLFRAAGSWVRSVGTFQNQLSLEYDSRNYEELNYTTENIRLMGSQTGSWTPEWLWRLNGDVSSSTYARDSELDDEVLIGGLRSSLQRASTGNTSFIASYSGGVTGTSSETNTTHSLMADGRRDLGRGFGVIGGGSWTLQQYGTLSANVPAAYAGLQWRGSSGAWSTSLGGRINYSTTLGSDESNAGAASLLGTGGSVSLAYTGLRSLRADLVASYDTNQARMAGEEVPGIPGGDFSGIGTEDVAIARGTVSWTWSSTSLNLIADWGSRRTTAETYNNPGSSNRASVTAQAGLRWIGIFFGTGESSLDTDAEERVSFKSAGLSTNLGQLRLYVDYREDTTSVRLAPDVDGTQMRGGATLYLPLFSVDAYYWDRSDAIETAGERNDRGLRVSIGKSLDGWLPVISAPKRRGTIR